MTWQFSICATMSNAIGRPKGGIWDYFKFDEKENKSVCMVNVNSEDETLCGKVLKGKFPTNLKMHLKKCHAKECDQLEQEEKKQQEKQKQNKLKKKKSSSLQDSSLIQKSLDQESKKYGDDSAKQKAITHKLAIFIGGSNVAISLVENAEFRELITELNPCYQTPGRFKIGKEIDQIYFKLRHDITESLNFAEKISFCVDVWSKKGMSASFLGLTAHCYNREKKVKCNVTIAVRRFESPHTADRVSSLVDTILKEWRIPSYKIFRILTDNGSNMLAAFKQDVLLNANDEMRDKTDIGPDVEIIDAPDFNNDMETDDDVEVDEPAAEDTLNEDQTENYAECEMEHEIAFAEYQRVSCFVHTLQLVVHTYDKSSHLTTTMSKAQRLVNKMNKSVKATEKLIAMSKKKLVSACPTRWSSSFLMISRLLEIKASVISVCEELGWDCLSSYQWKQLESVEHLLKPFAQYTTLTSGEDGTTISLVIPILLELQMHLDNEVSRLNVILDLVLNPCKNLVYINMCFFYIYDVYFYSGCKEINKFDYC